MNRILTLSLTFLFVFSTVIALQTRNALAGNTKNQAASTRERKRSPIFRANKEQVNQAQAILKSRGFYTGETTGKLDSATRAGLREYQKAEGLKVTGTLNRLTLEKMGIELTEKQKAM